MRRMKGLILGISLFAVLVVSVGTIVWTVRDLAIAGSTGFNSITLDPTADDTNSLRINNTTGTAQLTMTAAGAITFAGAQTFNGTLTLGDNGDTVAIDSSDWDISTVGAMTNINSVANTSADLALLTTTSGNITLTTAAAAAAVYVVTGNLSVGNGVPSVIQNGEDGYVEGTFEVDGATTLDGAVTLGDAAADVVTVTGTVAGGSPLVFEGATANDFETTIAITDPTADRTFTLPNASGTAMLTQMATADGVYHSSGVLVSGTLTVTFLTAFSGTPNIAATAQAAEYIYTTARSSTAATFASSTAASTSTFDYIAIGAP